MADKYGTGAFEVMFEAIWKRYLEIDGYDDGAVYEGFDYPDYWGIPRRVANKLRGDAVDVIQDEIESLLHTPKSKAQFRKSLREALFLLAH